MSSIQLNTAVSRCPAGIRHAASCLLGVLLALCVTAGNGPAMAGELKLNSPCNQLLTADVTKVDNPACRAVSAIYFDEDGKTIYFERLELDGKRRVAGRFVEVVRGCPENDPSCPGGCKAGCTLCLGGRCGCVC